MRKAIAVIMVLAMASFAWADNAQKVDATSKVDSVVVYPDRAQVTRTAYVDIGDNLYEVIFKDLPLGIDENSLRARLFDTTAAKVLGLETKRVFTEKPKSEKIKELQDKIQAFQDEMRLLNDTVQIINNRKAFIDALRAKYADKVSKDMAETKLDVEGIKGLLELIEVTMSKDAARFIEIDGKRRELNDKINALQNEINTLYSQQSKEYRTVIVSIEGARQEKVGVALSYVIYGASWRPVYDARVAREKKEVELISHGIITQNTGEDWKDVELTLSTAKPAMAGRPPELQARAVDFRYQQLAGKDESTLLRIEKKANTWQKSRERNSNIDKDSDIGLGEPDQLAQQNMPAPYIAAVAESGATAVFFKIKKREEIPSDGNPHKTTIALGKFKTEFEYETSPEVSPYAYLRASITNGDTMILPGEMSVFMDGDYVGTSWVKTVASSQKFDAYLGIDESIRIERKEIKHEDGSKGGFLSSSKKRKTYGYKITIENFRKEEIKLTMNERIPVSRNQDIKVELDNTTDGYTKDEQGILKWKLELKPTEKKIIELGYSVYYPADKEIMF